MPPEACTTTMNEVRKCPGRVTEPRQSGAQRRSRRGNSIETKSSPAQPSHVCVPSHFGPRGFSSRQWKGRWVRVRARLLNHPTGRESVFKRESVIPTPQAHSNPECRPLDRHHAQWKSVEGNGRLIGAASNNSSQQNASTHISQLLNISAQTRVLCDKIFNAIGYGGMNLSTPTVPSVQTKNG